MKKNVELVGQPGTILVRENSHVNVSEFSCGMTIVSRHTPTDYRGGVAREGFLRVFCQANWADPAEESGIDRNRLVHLYESHVIVGAGVAQVVLDVVLKGLDSTNNSLVRLL